MGKLWKEIMPHTNTSSASPRIRKRLLRAKSTSPLIMVSGVGPSSLLDRVLEHERVRHDGLPGLETRDELLHFTGQRVPADHFHALEAARGDGHVDPLPVVQVQDGR